MSTTLELTIEKVVHGGMGLARTAEGIVFVSGVLPDEKVHAMPVGRKSGIVNYRPVELVESSPQRRTPPCAHFGTCGGCDWLFAEYPLQTELKRAIFIEALERIGKLPAGGTVPQILAGPEFGYRRRAQIKIDREKRAGFFKRESNDVVSLSGCPLCTDRICSLLMRCGSEPQRLPDGLDNLKVVDGDAVLASHPVLDGITSAAATITCGGTRFDVSGDDFFQSNAPLLAPMAEWIASYCGGGTLVDLYGGTGFFSAVLADKFEKGLLIESQRSMVERARWNFRHNGISRFKAVAAPAETLERHIRSTPDVMIVDPPRPGLTRDAREAVGRIGATTLIYVSCNCATQARDVGYLVKKCGYSVTASALIDLYPNTHHTETVMVLRKG